jgi:hypothetical protein
MKFAVDSKPIDNEKKHVEEKEKPQERIHLECSVREFEHALIIKIVCI